MSKPLEQESRCNDCNFKRYLKGSHRTLKMWRIEQIIKGSYINLCTYHAAFYWLKRFKWWLNSKSGHKLEGVSKWWIR